MPGKRRRIEVVSTETAIVDTTPAPSQPISAIAAARQKLEAQLKAQKQPDISQETATSPIVEPTSDYAESDFEEDDTPAAATLIHKNLKLCNWHNISTNILSNTDEEFTIVLEKHSTVSFVGCFDVNVLKGAVNINGANIGAVPRQGEEKKSWRVYVPSTHPVTKIRGLDRVNHVQFLSCKEPAPLSEISPPFAGIWASRKKSKRSFEFIPESDADPLSRPLTPEAAPEDWLRAIEEIALSSSPVVLITGAAQSGKSTFAKRLLNRHLTGMGKTAKPVPAVCYLDLDPWNPEYTTHGQISLTVVRQVNLGPAFTHPAAPTKAHQGQNETLAAHPIPLREFASYIDYFSAAVLALYQNYKKLFQASETAPPLIINTPSILNTSPHFTLLTSLLPTLQPNHTVHLSPPSPSFPTPSAADAETTSNLQTLTLLARTKTSSHIYDLTAYSPPAALPPQRSPQDLRSMSTQSYFHLSSLKPPHPKWSCKPLTSALTPWEFSYQETQSRTQDISTFATLLDIAVVPPTQISTILNGSLIHILQTHSPYPNAAEDTKILRTPKYKIPYTPPSPSTGTVAPPDPPKSRRVCTALIHSFDPQNRIVNVLIPKTHESLVASLTSDAGEEEEASIIFVAGCCEDPEWAYLEEGGGEGVWIEEKKVVEGMGYFCAGRRVRKFLG